MKDLLARVNSRGTSLIEDGELDTAKEYLLSAVRAMPTGSVGAFVIVLEAFRMDCYKRLGETQPEHLSALQGQLLAYTTLLDNVLDAARSKGEPDEEWRNAP